MIINWSRTPCKIDVICNYTQSDVRIAIRDKDSNYIRSFSHERRWRYPPSHSRLCPKLATTSTCITLPPNSRVTDGQFKSIGRSGVHHVTLPPPKVCESNRVRDSIEPRTMIRPVIPCRSFGVAGCIVATSDVTFYPSLRLLINTRTHVRTRNLHYFNSLAFSRSRQNYNSTVLLTFW